MRPEERRHGTEYSHDRYGCRCDPCVAAHDAHLARRRAAKMARRLAPGPYIFDRVLVENLVNGLLYDLSGNLYSLVVGATGRRGGHRARPEYVEAVRILAARGYDDYQIAEHFTRPGRPKGRAGIFRLRHAYAIAAPGTPGGHHHGYSGCLAPAATR